jgi:hypothetical protein
MGEQYQARRWPAQTLVLIVVLIGVLLRLTTLESKSLWYDEAYTVQRAALPIEGVWSESGRARTDSHPPLYYAGLHYWMAVTGQSEAVLRLPSAVASIANLGLLYLLGRRLFGREAALVALALLALSPLDLWYAQEARMYIFMCSVGLLLAIGLWWEHWLALPLLTIVCIAGLYLDYTMLPIWMGISAVWLVGWWQEGRSIRQFLYWAISALVAWLVFRPWYPNFANMLDRLDDVTLFDRIRVAVGLPDLLGWHFLVVLVCLTLLMILLARPLQRWLQQAASQGWFAWPIFAAFALITLFILFPRFYSIKRVMVQAWPFVILFVSWLLVRQQRYRNQLWQLLLSVSLAGILTITFLIPKDDWRGAIAYVNEHANSDAILWLDPHWIIDVAAIYRPSIRTQRGNQADLEQLPGREIWLISERYPNLPIPYSASEVWLDQNLELDEATPFFRLEVRRYRSR